MRMGVILITSIVLAGVAGMVAQGSDDKKPLPKKADGTPVSSILDFKMDDIDGKSVDLNKYKGKVVMVVNVASRCGLTPQYTQLEEVYDKYKDKGLVVLGFAANNFMGQEPGSNKEIKQFCSGKYDVSFDMFSKISVQGDDMCDLYNFLTSKEANGEYGGKIRWNFDKFLVGRDGKVINRFHPRTKPNDKKVVEAVEAALAVKP